MSSTKDESPDWREAKSLSECMMYTLKSEIKCDVTFKIGEDKTPVKAHKYILSTRSQVFHTMFEGPMSETGDIDIPDIDTNTFDLILENRALHAFMRWMEMQCQINNRETNGENMREIANKLLYLVRFPEVDMMYFSENVSKSGVLNSNKIISIYQSHFGEKNDLFPNKPRNPYGKKQFRSVANRFSEMHLNKLSTGLHTISFYTSRDIWGGHITGTATSDIIDWKQVQTQDVMVKNWIDMVKKEQKPANEDSILKRQYHHLKIIEGILYRQVETDDYTEPPVQREKPVPKSRLKKKQTTPVISIRPESQGVHSDESSDEEPLELVIVKHDASSDTTITEEQHDDSTVTDKTEDSDSDGDAHSQEATDMEAEGTETESVIRSASTVTSSPEPVRRSTRERQQPAWMRSGTFDLSKSVGTPVSDSEWYKKVQFITSLAGTHLFRDLQSEAAKTILDIVKAPSAKK
ncbi:BTBD3_6 [Mytilus edulis]|uniref:BTBD3_6 n=1 Tax=Mytilus edulis TaxID=6550 RepID=A0A8S3T7B0_MYTED|nr:BTBD3_6 [Mytilus edulis]